MVDLVIQNARLWDGTGPLPRAASLILRRGRLVELAAADVSLDVPTIDVRGSVVTPGLVDAHLHLMLGGETIRQVDLSQVTGRESFEATIEQAAASLPPDRWLVASGWNETLWSCGEQPDRSWLAAAGSRPAPPRVPESCAQPMSPDRALPPSPHSTSSDAHRAAQPE